MVLNVFLLLLFFPFAFDVHKDDVLLLYAMMMISMMMMLVVAVVDEHDDENQLNEIFVDEHLHN